MSNQYTPDAEDLSSAKKRSQQRLLLLLLLLIALFAYLYFFTGLIKPRGDEAQAPPAPAQPAPVAVKQPLPPRPATAEAPASAEAPAGAPAAAPAGTPAAAAPAKPTVPASAAAPAGKPAATAAKPAAQTSAAKPAAPAATPAKPAAQAKAEKPAAPASKQKAAKPATAAKEAKPATAAKEAKPATAAKDAKTAAAAKEAKPATAAKSAKATAKPAAGAYALEINGDLAESEMGSVTAKLKKAGIGNVVQTKAQKGEPMHRLFLSDFGDRNEAAEELERLKLVAPSAFMLKENGRYAVYAGSYLRQGKAATEQDRLYDKGVRLLLKEATIPVNVVKLRAGSYPDQTSAEKAANSLKKSGVSAKVVKAGK